MRRRFVIVGDLDESIFSDRDRQFIDALSVEQRQQAILNELRKYVPGNLAIQSVREIETVDVVL